MPEKESSTLPVLRARPGGPAERFAGLIGGSHPAATFFAALLLGYAMLAGLAILLGPVRHRGARRASLGLGGADQSAVEEIVAERTPFLTDVASVGAFTGGAPLLPVLVGLVGLVAAFKRQWLIAGFAVFVLCVESATYRVASIVVPARAPRRQAPRGPARGRELPVRPHRRVARRLRRPGAPPQHAGEGRAGADRALGPRPRSCRSSSPSRACTRACTTRSTS